MENQVIKVLDVHYPDSDGNVFFDFQTLETQKGKDLQALIDQKIPIGCSMRAGGRGKRGKIGDKEATIATFLDLHTFDILFDPALKDTLGSIQPITDSEIASVLEEAPEKPKGTKNYSDAVDPFIQKVKGAATHLEVDEIRLEVEEVELDAIDRSAFETAYYRRRDQLWTKMRIARENEESARIGYVTDGEEQGEMKYTFEQLSKMTDEEIQRAKAEEPACAPMCDAILGSRKQADQLKALQDAEEKRKQEDAAKAFMDSKEVKEKVAKLPKPMQEKILARVDMTSKENAEQSFNDAFEFASSFVSDEKLKDLGFTPEQPMTDAARGTVNIQVNEKPSWLEVTDKLAEAAGDQYRMFNGDPDENLVKINKPIVDRLLKEFDKANGEQLTKFADDYSTSTNTSTVLNGVGFQRQIIAQAFQTVMALQFVQTQPFSGQFMEIPQENYQRANNLPLNNGEQRSMAKSKLSLDYVSVAAVARKLAAEVTKEVKTRLQSGPLSYDVAGRLVYHLAQDLNRDVSLRLHEEMLTASDEYNAVEVTGETPVINGDRTVLTLLRGGTPENPNRFVPVVTPRRISYRTHTGTQTVIENEVQVRLAGDLIDLSEAVIDYESGEILLKDALPAGEVKVDYSYATNIALFDMSVPNGISAEKHLNKLIHLIGQQKAMMGGEPRYYSPNFLMMSEGVSNEMSQAELFSTMFQKSGNDLQPGGYVGKVKGISAYEHNEPWRAGDSRILIGQKLGTKYGIGTKMMTEGPFPTRNEQGELTGGEEWYIFMDDAVNTPVKQVFNTIKLVNSQS
ncbi:hypothetical protein V4V35_23735 [Bacillus infantis]|uniref:hypothetical protein n=1 Tax=Bacillus infantis TaxID=324767 RepID=UPI002FBE8D68